MLSKRNFILFPTVFFILVFSNCSDNLTELTSNSTNNQIQPQTTRSQNSNNPTQTVLSIQMRTFESIISSLREYYVYGKELSVPYDDIETRYRTKILSLLDQKRFPDKIHDLIG